jgi:hypothetical protein
LTSSIGCAAFGTGIHTESMRGPGASDVFTLILHGENYSNDLTESMREEEASDVFTLILYGGNYSNDLETAAFLDRQGDAYSFDINAPEFNYRTIEGLTFEEGLYKAMEFVSNDTSFHQFRLNSIVNDKSQVIGYEMKPLYLPYTYGTNDVLDIWYTEKGNKVVVTVRLKPFIEKMKSRDGVDIR